MLFNSIDFAIFLPIVFCLYWFVLNRDTKVQNLFLLGASYVFYGWWNPLFLSLILLSSIIDYFIGLRIAGTNSDQKRKRLLLLSLLLNLGFLGFFKYYNFFLDSFVQAFSFFGHRFSIQRLDIILPVGISFYTFQTLSYSIDVYRKKLVPTKDFIAFASYVSFFPQLVAGPIERAVHLLPQFHRKRTFRYLEAADGMRQILWGLFKKVVVADNCAPYVNEIFANYTEYSGGILLLGAALFAFQIYGDFSGYSDIAIGTARLFGFRLMQNFAFPYFSRDMAEFWRRWHISLSTWFRDYLYIPLGGSRLGKWQSVRNTFVIFLVSGLWHGPNWTFVVWGFLNACYFLPLLLLQLNRKNLDTVADNRISPNIVELAQIATTFFLTCIAWVFFRATTISDGLYMVGKIFSMSFFKTSLHEISIITKGLDTIFHLFYISLLVIIEWFNREQRHGLALMPQNSTWRWTFYLLLLTLVLLAGNFFQPTEFIYFQF